MKRPQAAARGSSGAGGGLFGRVKAFGKRILDKLFLRTHIWQTRKKVEEIQKAVLALERDLDVSVTLLSRKIDYLVAKVDAYADLDDANHTAMLKAFEERQEALAARLVAIEAAQAAGAAKGGKGVEKRPRSGPQSPAGD